MSLKELEILRNLDFDSKLYWLSLVMSRNSGSKKLKIEPSAAEAVYQSVALLYIL